MIDRVLKWIIWRWWSPYVIIVWDFPCKGSSYDLSTEHTCKCDFKTEEEARAWAFEHLDWRGKLKEEKK